MSSLTVEAIQIEALAIVDELGADKLTMRRVASRLGVEAPSLYHHVPNKDALLDRVAAALWADLPPAPTDGAWAARVRGRIAQWQAALAAHPHAAPLVAASPARAAGMHADQDGLRGALADAGVAHGDALLQALAVLVLAAAQDGSGSGGDWLDGAVDLLLAGAGEAPARAEEEPAEEAHGEVEDHPGDEDLDEAGDTAADGPAADEGVDEDPAAEPPVAEAPAAPTPTPAPPPPVAAAPRPAPPPPAPRPVPTHKDPPRGRGGLLRGIARRLVGNDE